MKKFLSVLLALAMIFSLTVTVSADETKGEMDGYVVVLHTNDVHGAISGYAKVAALKKAYEAEGAYVLLMDAGDFCQGDPTVSVSQGKTAVELMNMAGYDVTTLGNHEFDYGYDNLVNLSKEAKFPIVAANVLYQGKVAFNSNQIFTTPSGVKIGVFGLETPETATKAHPAKIKGVTILGDKSMFDCAQAQVDSLKADGCDYIICLGHLGIDKESLGNRSTDLLNVVDGIDVFIDGHSHSTMKDIAEVTDKDGKVNGTLLTSTGTKLAGIGCVVISKDGITATQMDIKVDGLSYEVLAAALEQARKGRMHILGKLTECIAEPREDYKPCVPRIVQIVIPQDMIGPVIGPGGKVIQDIQKTTNTTITITEVDNKGIVDIFGIDKEALDGALARIKAIVAIPEVGETYHGKVRSIVAFGAFVEIMPGKDALLHISEIDYKRFETMEETGLKEGDEIDVKLIGVDPKTNKLKLSRKALLPKPEGYVERERRPRPERGERGERRDRGERRERHEHKEE